MNMDVSKNEKLHNKLKNTNIFEDVSEGFFYLEWKDNEISKLYFAPALIKKRGFIFSITEYMRGK